MKIGIFTDTFMPQINGVVTSTRILVKELNKLGHKVYIFTVKDPRVSDHSPRVFRLPSMPFVFLPAFRMSIMYSPKAVRMIKKLDLDVIHTQTEFSLGFFGSLVSRITKVPSVHTYHTMYEDYVHYIARGRLVSSQMAKDFSRVFCNNAKAVIAPTNKALEALTEYGVKKPIYIIPTGINIEPFKKENFTHKDIIDLKLSFGILETDFVLICVGRIASEKSMDVIIKQLPEILKYIPNAKFVIVGNGPVKKDLETLAKKLEVSDSVIFTGEQPWENIGRFYQMGDVFISASVTETQGLTFAEAMASEIAVVAKRDKSVEDLIIDNVTGRFFEDDNEVPSIIFDIYSNKAKYQEIIRNAYNAALNLSSIQFAKSVCEVYKAVINDHEQNKKKRTGLKIFNGLKRIKIKKMFQKTFTK